LNGSCLSAIPGLMLYHSGRTDIGCRRQKNDDSIGFFSNGEPPYSCLFVVADGVGGSAAGDVASQLAVDTIGRLFFVAGDPVDPARSLGEALASANRVICDRTATDPRLAGMATTCTAAVIRGQEIWLAHVGDCRAYLIGDGGLKQLTSDHSVAADYERQGRVLPPEKQGLANVLTRWLGSDEKFEVDLSEAIPLPPGHTLLICSDGLTKVVDTDDILQIVSMNSPDQACPRLIDLARKRGGPDNITVMLAKLTRA